MSDYADTGFISSLYTPDANTERALNQMEQLGTRSLDILHVAMAVVLGCESFLSFDIRQVKLARAAGLHVPRL